MNKKFAVITLIISYAVAACNNASQMNTKTDTPKAGLSSDTSLIPLLKNFQTSIDGKQTNLYILKNKKMQVTVTNYGARVVSIIVPDKNGNSTDVAVGYDAVQPYTQGGDTYFGAIVGRYGNRIAKGKFTLDGKEYTTGLTAYMVVQKAFHVKFGMHSKQAIHLLRLAIFQKMVKKVIPVI